MPEEEEEEEDQEGMNTVSWRVYKAFHDDLTEPIVCVCTFFYCPRAHT